MGKLHLVVFLNSLYTIPKKFLGEKIEHTYRQKSENRRHSAQQLMSVTLSVSFDIICEWPQTHINLVTTRQSAVILTNISLGSRLYGEHIIGDVR